MRPTSATKPPESYGGPAQRSVQAGQSAEMRGKKERAIRVRNRAGISDLAVVFSE